ncbi:MAG: RluA family pseudouridine synthase [Oscillospiraceae bacterium]|nr:RluA family pseudouridine synthase [Oscillospiraceae bacterium]
MAAGREAIAFRPAVIYNKWDKNAKKRFIFNKNKEGAARVRYLEFSVLPEEAGKRVDAILRSHGLSTSAIRRSKHREHGLLVDGEDIYTSYLVHAGQVVAILADDNAPSDIIPNEGPVDILYEDGDLLVVDKPAGLAVHPCAGSWEDSLGARLVHYYRQIGLAADFHPVHRLDKGTSGLMVVAKHPAAQHILTKQLHTGGFHREYLAVCEGHPSPTAGIIDAPIGRSDDSYIRQEVRPDGKSARTHYEILEQSGRFSLLRLVLETGRTHQIRVHMAHLGHPLAGDFLYGTEDPGLISRPALHSAHLELAQPFTGKQLTFGSPLPEDMARLMELPT